MSDKVSNIGNGAVDGGEIDIFEILPNAPWQAEGKKTYLNSAVHWDGYGRTINPMGISIILMIPSIINGMKLLLNGLQITTRLILMIVKNLSGIQQKKVQRFGVELFSQGTI